MISSLLLSSLRKNVQHSWLKLPKGTTSSKLLNSLKKLRIPFIPTLTVVTLLAISNSRFCLLFAFFFRNPRRVISDIDFNITAVLVVTLYRYSILFALYDQISFCFLIEEIIFSVASYEFGFLAKSANGKTFFYTPFRSYKKDDRVDTGNTKNWLLNDLRFCEALSFLLLFEFRSWKFIALKVNSFYFKQ